MEYIHTLSVKFGKYTYRIMQNDWQYLIYTLINDSYIFQGSVFQDEVRKNASAKSIVSKYLES